MRKTRLARIIPEMAPDHSRAYERRLAEVEREIRDLAIEIAYVVDADGTVIARRRGSRSVVDLDDLLAAGELAGRTIIHNHPNGTSLSNQDVHLLLVSKAHELRVVTDRFTFSLRVPERDEWEDVEALVGIPSRQVIEVCPGS